MRRGHNLKLGYYNQICDRTGFKVKSDKTKKEWTHNIVRTKDWEERQPLDFLRAIRDHQAVANPRSESEDDFLDPTESDPLENN